MPPYKTCQLGDDSIDDHNYRTRPDGTVDFDFYRSQAAALRRQAIQETGHSLHRSGKTAAASIVARCGAAFGAMLNWMFPAEPSRPWSR